MGIPVLATEIARQEMADLLRECGLSDADILHPDSKYWLAYKDGSLVGICGVEFENRFVLMRSVCVRSEFRRDGIARRLVAHALNDLSERGCECVYLFSKDTGAYFERLGWKEVPVAEARTILSTTPQVRRYEETGWYPDERAFRLDCDSGSKQFRVR